MGETKNWNQDGVAEFEERVVQVSRITKVVKGGKRSRFRALIVVGKEGKVGLGLGKSGEVPVAIRKAVERAKKSLVNVTIIGGTIPHQVVGVFGASRVMMKPARSGTGVIAGGSVRTMLELAGVKDVVAKSLGSGNPLNTALATLSAFRLLRSVDVEAKVRGKVLGIRRVGSMVDGSGLAPIGGSNEN